MLAAADYNRRITIYRNIVEIKGGVLKQMGDAGTLVSAAYAPVQGNEALVAAGQRASERADFTVRWSTETKDLKPKDWLVFNSRNWEIVSIEEKGWREDVVLHCVLRNSNA